MNRSDLSPHQDKTFRPVFSNSASIRHERTPKQMFA